MSYLTTNELEPDGYEDSPQKILFPILGFCGLIIFFSVFIAMINSGVSATNHNNFSDGVRRATSAYSQRYDLSNSNLKTLAEGYLMNEDLSKFKVESNPVNVQKDLAEIYFFNILSGNVTKDVDTLKNYKLYICHIYTIYQVSNSTGVNQKSYALEISDSKGVNLCTTALGTTQEVSNKVSSIVGGVKTDISSSLENSIHRAQKYTRNNSLNESSNSTVSSFNTYMTIGKDIPIEGRFVTENEDFCEIQTYSTMR